MQACWHSVLLGKSFGKPGMGAALGRKVPRPLPSPPLPSPAPLIDTLTVVIEPFPFNDFACTQRAGNLTVLIDRWQTGPPITSNGPLAKPLP